MSPETPTPRPPGLELPSPVHESVGVRLYRGDAVALLPRLPSASIDSLVTDPPYGLGFNGHSWDGVEGFRQSLPGIDTSGMTGPEIFETWCTAWAEGALHALKPGAYLAAFGGARTWHRLARGIENAGFEVRDQIAWLHSSGMPKSMDVAFALDKYHAVQRTDRTVQQSEHEGVLGATRAVLDKGTPVTEDAQQWDGWGTALRPAFEPIILARKPPGASIAHNILTNGVGGINIDATRFNGRWPTNVALDGSQADALDLLTGTWRTDPVSRRFPIFRYQPKAPPSERPRAFGISHSTVKPLALMRWLARLITPPGGVLLEPFTGSGTTIEAAVSEGFQVVAFEKDPDYIPLIISRLELARYASKTASC